jgi:DNA-binding NtrC family response regulator
MKLLIVDDEIEICEMLQEYFEEHLGFEVVTATNASDALSLLVSEQPEGMLLDLNLKSKLGGFEILKRVKAVSPLTKVIMVTGDCDLVSIETAMELGAVDYITKPFTIDYLEETVQTKIANALMYA